MYCSVLQYVVVRAVCDGDQLFLGPPNKHVHNIHFVAIYIYMYIYICKCIYIYIYIHIYDVLERLDPSPEVVT